MQGPPSVAKISSLPARCQPRCGAVQTLKTVVAADRSWPTGRPRPVRCEHAVVIAEPVVVCEALGRCRSSGLAAGLGSGTGRAGTAPYRSGDRALFGIPDDLAGVVDLLTSAHA